MRPSKKNMLWLWADRIILLEVHVSPLRRSRDKDCIWIFSRKLYLLFLDIEDKLRQGLPHSLAILKSRQHPQEPRAELSWQAKAKTAFFSHTCIFSPHQFGFSFFSHFLSYIDFQRISGISCLYYWLQGQFWVLKNSWPHSCSRSTINNPNFLGVTNAVYQQQPTKTTMTPRAVFSSRLGKGEAASYKLFIRGVGGREIERVIDTPNIWFISCFKVAHLS